MSIENSTFSGNSTSELSGSGGAINAQSTLVDIVFSTFYLNTARKWGSAIATRNSPVRIKNSLVVGSGVVGNCSGEFSSSGRNYSTDSTCPGFAVVTSDELRLGPLADNGGPTATHALLSGSVAIDSAPDCNNVRGRMVDSDQRGAPRPFGAACDVGAYEAGSTPEPSRTPTPTWTASMTTPTWTATPTVMVTATLPPTPHAL
jgi:predicted outer membrane repeat protein